MGDTIGQYLFQVTVWICTIPGICLAGFGIREALHVLDHLIKKTGYKGILFIFCLGLLQIPQAYWIAVCGVFFWACCMIYQGWYMHEIHTTKYLKGLAILLVYVLGSLGLERFYFGILNRTVWDEVIIFFVPVEMLCVLLFYLVNKVGRHEKWNFILVYLEFISILEFLIVHMGIVQGKIDKWMWFVFLGILGNAVMTYMLLHRVYKKDWKLIITEEPETPEEEIYEYYLRLDAMQIEIRKMYHDMKNHLMVLEDTLEVRENEELKNYVNDLKNTLADEEAFVVTGYRELDIYLYKMKTEAKAHFIELDITIEKDCLNSIPLKVVMTLISNAIDNAMEACKKMEVSQRRIEVKAMRIENRVMVFIKNAIPKEMEKSLDTKKQNKERHGLGILNMKEAVEKNGGLLSIENEQGYFQVSALFEMD